MNQEYRRKFLALDTLRGEEDGLRGQVDALIADVRSASVERRPNTNDVRDVLMSVGLPAPTANELTVGTNSVCGAGPHSSRRLIARGLLAAPAPVCRLPIAIHSTRRSSDPGCTLEHDGALLASRMDRQCPTRHRPFRSWRKAPASPKWSPRTFGRRQLTRLSSIERSFQPGSHNRERSFHICDGGSSLEADRYVTGLSDVRAQRRRGSGLHDGSDDEEARCLGDARHNFHHSSILIPVRHRRVTGVQHQTAQHSSSRAPTSPRLVVTSRGLAMKVTDEGPQLRRRFQSKLPLQEFAVRGIGSKRL